MAIFSTIWGWVQSLIGLVLPVFAQAGDLRRLGPVLRWALHIVVVAGIVVGLYLLNNSKLVKMNEKVEGPEWLRQAFLPLLFILIYSLGWLGWLLWKLMATDEEVSYFPDIDEAWQEAVQALNAQDIYLTDVPVFLVIGRPFGGEQALFEAAHLDFAVSNVPADDSAPLHVYANKEAKDQKAGIYVTCAGASVLGRLALVLNSEPASTDSVRNDDPGEEEDQLQIFNTIANMSVRGGKDMARVQELLRKKRKGNGDEEDEAELQRLMKVDRRVANKPGEKKPRAERLLKKTEQVDEACARLRHLCRLIAKDRYPYCPINGVMLLVPFAATENDADAHDTGLVCRGDLVQIRRAVQLHCPVFALVCDMERVPGFSDFIRRFPEPKRLRRLGQGFPMLAVRETVEGVKLPDLIADGVRWICDQVFPMWIHELFLLEKQDRPTFNEVVQKNSQLFKLMNMMHIRQVRLTKVVQKAIVPDEEDPLLFGGCYLAGTGRSKSNCEQSFVAGVFRKFPQEQEAVAWTYEAIVEDEQWKKWTRAGYIFIGVLVAAAVAFAVWRFILRSP